MRKTAFTEEQVVPALPRAESGTPVAEVVRKLGISKQMLYLRKKKVAGMGVAELRRLRQHEIATGHRQARRGYRVLYVGQQREVR